MKIAQPFQQATKAKKLSRGPNVLWDTSIYRELTAARTDNEGWYYSGDLCRMDEDGYIKITGRKKDIIIRR